MDCLKVFLLSAEDFSVENNELRCLYMLSCRMTEPSNVMLRKKQPQMIHLLLSNIKRKCCIS